MNKKARTERPPHRESNRGNKKTIRWNKTPLHPRGGRIHTCAPYRATLSREPKNNLDVGEFNYACQYVKTNARTEFPTLYIFLGNLITLLLLYLNIIYMQTHGILSTNHTVYPLYRIPDRLLIISFNYINTSDLKSFTFTDYRPAYLEVDSNTYKTATHV